MLTIALVVCMVFSLTTVVSAAGNAVAGPVLLGVTPQIEYYAEPPEARDPGAEEDSLREHMEYFVNHIGQRLAGTPNEDKAAAYIKDQFEAIGYTDV